MNKLTASRDEGGGEEIRGRDKERNTNRGLMDNGGGIVCGSWRHGIVVIIEQ